MPAASAAEAFVAVKTSEKCCGLPAPLLAITGIPTASDTALTSSKSKPLPCRDPYHFTVELTVVKANSDIETNFKFLSKFLY